MPLSWKSVLRTISPISLKSVLRTISPISLKSVLRTISPISLKSVLRIIPPISWKSALCAIPPIAILLLFVFHHVRFVSHTPERIVSDGQYARSVNYYEYLESGDEQLLLRYGEPFFWIMAPQAKKYPYYNAFPPLTYIVTAGFYSRLGVSIESARQSIVLFEIILLLAMFGIGHRLGGYCGGLVVMALMGSSPYLEHISHYYVLDLPQTAMSALAIYLLLRSESFKRAGSSFAFGLILALSFLTKWSTGIYLFLPMVGLYLPSVFRSRRSFLLSLAVCAAVGVMVFGTFKSLRFALAPAIWTENHMWLFFYGLYFALPALLLVLLTAGLERRWRSLPEEKLRGVLQQRNFALALAFFVVVACPWHVFMAGEIYGNLMHYSTHLRVYGWQDTVAFVLDFYRSSFVYALPLMAIGLVFLVRRREGRYEGLVLLGSTVIVTLAMFQTGRPNNFVPGNLQVRVILSLMIGATFLGGFWFGALGRIRYLLSALVILLAIGSVRKHDGNSLSGRQLPGWTNPGLAVPPSIPAPTEELDILLDLLGDLECGPGLHPHLLLLYDERAWPYLDDERFYAQVLTEGGKLMFSRRKMPWKVLSGGVGHPDKGPLEHLDCIALLHRNTKTLTQQVDLIESTFSGEFRSSGSYPWGRKRSLMYFERERPAPR